MKRILKKVLVIMLIFLTINNFMFSSVSQASIGEDIINTIANGIIGIFAYPIQLFLSLVGRAINLVTAGVASVDDESTILSITPFDILFSGAKNNKSDIVKIVRVNFFDTSIEDDSIIGRIRNGISTWYYILRMLACVILLVILVYVGIRMALTTIASDKAMYTKMITDWACSLALIFLLQYIMIFTFTVNDALVNAMSVISDNTNVSDAFDEIFWNGFHFGVDGLACAAVYFILVTQTIGLLISYINRMLKVAFLMIISPLITLTYSIDKMGDGKAQALGTWLKEFVYTVLMQPFHCIIYMIMVSTSLNLLTDHDFSDNKIGYAVLAIICIRFVQEAEKIVRKIFHFEDDNSGTSVAAGMAMSAMALSHSKNIGKTLKSGVTGARNLATNAKSLVNHAKTDALVMGAILTRNNTRVNKEDGTIEKMSYAELKDEVQANRVQKQADKLGKQVYGRISGNARYSDLKSTAKREDIKNEDDKKRYDQLRNSGMNHSLAMATLRKEKLQKDKKEKDAKDHPTRTNAISKARGTVSSISSKVNAIKQMDTFKDLQKMGAAYLSAGTGAAVGLAMYGNGQNFMQSSMAAAAAFGSMQEFSKDTTKTLVNDAVQSVAALSGDSAEEKEQHLRYLAQSDGTEFKDNSDRIKGILSDLERQLQQLGMDKNSVNTFKNKIHNEVRSNAIQGNKVPVSDVVQKHLNAYNNTTAGHIKPINMAKDLSALNNAALKTSDFENDKIVYDRLQKLMQGGASAETAIGDIMKTYKAYDSSSMPIVNSEFSQDRFADGSEEDSKVQEHNKNVDKIDDDVQKETDAEVKRIIKEFDSKKDDTLTKNFAKDIMDDARATIADELKDEIKDIVKATTLEQSKRDSEFARIKAELDKELKAAIAAQKALEDAKDKVLKGNDTTEIIRTQKALAENIYKIQYINSAETFMKNEQGSSGGN